MTTDAAALNEIIQSLHEQVALLASAAQIEPPERADLRDELVRNQLLRAAEILRGAAVLGSAQNAICLGIVSRSLLELLISSLWLVRSIENASAHQSAAKAELAKALRLNLEAGKAKIKERATGKDVTVEFLDTEQMKKPARRLSVEQQAKEADVLDIYTVFYRFMSLETHGHSESPQSASDIRELCEVHLQGIGAVSRAIGQVCVWWLMHRSWPDNESIREVLGLNSEKP